MRHVFCLEDCINFTCEVTTSVVFALTCYFICAADSFTNLGLPVLRGVQNPVPRRSDTHPPQ